MRTVSYRLADLQKATIRLGRVGENDYTRVMIDGKIVFDEYPRAVPALTVQPPSGAAYPAVTTREGDWVIWDVTDSNLAVQGIGEAQLTFTQDGVVCKSWIFGIRVERSIVARGDAPDPVEDWLAAANTALNAIPQTIDDALEEAKESGEFDGPPGPPGDPGDPGQPGDDGFSPTVTVTDITGGHRVTVTDANGSHTFDVMDGEKGDPGQPGAKGDKGDPGTPGDPTTLIDDTSTTATDKTWSVSKLNNQISQKYTKPESGIPAEDLASGVIPSVPVQDVQINGSSILSQGVANVPVMSDNVLGVAKINVGGQKGIDINSNKELRTRIASSLTIKQGVNTYQPVAPSLQHESTFYGLAKAAGADMASLSSVTVGQYPDAQKIAIQKMLGIYEAPWELIREDTFTNDTEADHIITVDGNGNAFELTDVRLLFELPKVDAVASKGYYGQIWFYYDSTNHISAEPGSFSRSTTTDYAKGCWYFVDYDDGMVMTTIGTPAINTNATALKSRYITYTSSNADGEMGIMLNNNFSVKKINIKSVTGTGHYKLYGKRKWN